MSIVRFFLSACVVVTLVYAAPAQAQTTINVLVDSGAEAAIKELAKVFEKENKVKVKVTGGSTEGLAGQISNGTPCDLFLCGSKDWAEQLALDGMATKSSPLLTNTLVLIVPVDNPAGIKAPEDLLGDQVKKVALANPAVPVGKYAQQALVAAQAFEDLTKAKKIARGKDVATTRGMVEKGEAEAGIVFSTDAHSDKVAVVYTFEEPGPAQIVYPLVLTRAGGKGENVKKLFDYLTGEDANATYEKYGFARPVHQ